jgi:hypothetical protein
VIGSVFLQVKNFKREFLLKTCSHVAIENVALGVKEVIRLLHGTSLKTLGL